MELPLRGYLVLTPAINSGEDVPEDERLIIKSKVIAAPESFWSQIGWGDAKSDTHRSTLAGMLTIEQLDILLQAVSETKAAEISNESIGKGRNGERIGVGFSMAGESESGTLMGIDVYPRIASDEQSVDIEVHPSNISPNTQIHPSLTRSTEQPLTQ